MAFVDLHPLTSNGQLSVAEMIRGGFYQRFIMKKLLVSPRKKEGLVLLVKPSHGISYFSKEQFLSWHCRLQKPYVWVTL